MCVCARVRVCVFGPMGPLVHSGGRGCVGGVGGCGGVQAGVLV